jgi:hypothetical protein
MFESELEYNNDQRYLVVYYDKTIGNFNKAIDRVLIRHKLDSGSVPILCLPKKEIKHEPEKVFKSKTVGPSGN